jgi:transcription factor SFP1
MTPDGDSQSERLKREYKCPRPYCSKVYKNTNGLKYHMERGNCEVETLVKKGPLKQLVTPPPRKASPATSFDDAEYTEDDTAAASAAAAAAAADLSEQEIDLLSSTTDIKVITRPYICRVNGCGKKYKNLNGLKYHHKSTHPNLDFLRHVRAQSTSHPNSGFHHLLVKPEELL